ncbi:ComEC/Rec2 family competence protein [bacterium]|nr:ComEC/Rec2 family competence protein [bacterium]
MYSRLITAVRSLKGEGSAVIIITLSLLFGQLLPLGWGGEGAFFWFCGGGLVGEAVLLLCGVGRGKVGSAILLALLFLCSGAFQVFFVTSSFYRMASAVPPAFERRDLVPAEIRVRSLPRRRRAGAVSFTALVSSVAPDDRPVPLGGLGSQLSCTAKDLPWRNGAELRLGAVHRGVVRVSLYQRPFSRWERAAIRRGTTGRCEVHWLSHELENTAPFRTALRAWTVDRSRTVFSAHGSGGVLRGMIFGEGDEIDRRTKERFQRWGITHLLVVSGLHIVALGVLLRWLGEVMVWPLFTLQRGFFWQRFFPELFALLGIWGYVTALGVPTSALRAAIAVTLYGVFGILSSLCLARGRALSLFGAPIGRLSLTALLLLSLWPGIGEELGFQLTFSALLSLALVNWWKHRKALSRCSVWLLSGVLPTVVTGIVFFLHTGRGSLLAPLGNLFLAPLLLCCCFYGGAAAFLLAVLPIPPLSALGLMLANGIEQVVSALCRVL